MTDEMRHDADIPEEEYIDVYTLTDDETGEEITFELLAEADIDGAHYVAMAPMDDAALDGEEGQYIILRVDGEGDEKFFSTIDDDDTFDKVAEFFDDLFFEDVDYDD